MLMDELFFQLVDDMKKVFTEKPGETFLANIGREYGLSHVSYLGINMPHMPEGKLLGITTYNDKWQRRYVSEEYVDIDPVVKLGFGGILPFDWSSFRRDGKRVRDFMGESQDFGIGKQGLSFPIRGMYGETALFSINSHLPDREWKALKRKCMRDFQIIAHNFHTKVLERDGVQEMFAAALTQREVECLKWAAAGKTAWETGVILGISQSTVDFFIEQTRVKLTAANKTQAVAKAIRMNLI